MDDVFSGIHPDTPIYRIIDFFAFARMIEDRTLYVPLATAFSDENEGIDAILGGLLISASLARYAINLSWKNHEEAIHYHQVLRRTHYVTCWTRQVDSVALWSLYSKDQCSVSIQTTVRKLRRSLDDHWDMDGKQKLLAAKLGQVVLGTSNVIFGPVQYCSLSKLKARVDRFGKAIDRLDKRLERRGELLIDHFWKKAHQHENKLGRSYKLLRDLTCRPFLAKDESYAHESEIRGVLQIGQVQLDQEHLDYIRELLALEPSFRHSISFFFTHPPDGDYQKQIYLKVPQDFIDSVRIDPRCPAHKADFIARFAHQNRIPILEATAFGYLPQRACFDDYSGALRR